MKVPERFWRTRPSCYCSMPCFVPWSPWRSSCSSMPRCAGRLLVSFRGCFKGNQRDTSLFGVPLFKTHPRPRSLASDVDFTQGSPDLVRGSPFFGAGPLELIRMPATSPGQSTRVTDFVRGEHQQSSGSDTAAPPKKHQTQVCS